MKAWWVVLLLAGLACREAKEDPPPPGDGEVDADEGGDASAIWPDGTPHAADEIWVMTWNIERFPKTTGAVQRVAEILTQVNPDIVAVQEIRDVPSFVLLDDTLPQYERVLPLDDPGSDDTIVGLLYRTGVVEVSGTETLFTGDWSAFPRLPVKVRARMNGVDFTVVVLHLKAGVGEDDETRRRDAVMKLDTWTRAELAEGTERDVLLVGDFNSSPAQDVSDNIFGPFLDAADTYRVLTLPQAQADEYTYLPFMSMLDNAVITTDMLTEMGSGETDILELEQSVDGFSTNITDHRPVLIKMRP